MAKKALLAMAVVLCLLISSSAWADEFGIVSETHIYPDGLRLDTDSKLQWWNNIVTSDDYTAKAEGKKSLKGYVPIAYMWFGFGIIWDPNQDNTTDPKNMSAYANGSLKFWVRTQTTLKVGIQDAIGTQKWVYLNQAPFNIPSDNQWRFVIIPCNTYFTGIDFSQLTQLFMVAQSQLPSGVGLTFNLDNIRWDTQETAALNNITVRPSPWTIPNNLPKGFIAKGYDVTGSTYDVYPAWSKTGFNGTFIDSDDPIAIFTPSSTGSGSISATQNAISGSAAITVADITWNDFFNLLIDGGLYGSLGIFDADGTGTNNSISLATVTDEHPPAYRTSLKTTYTVTDNGYAGLFIQEGELTDTISTRDVSLFQNGYLHFWVKTPEDLQISLRTGNINAGGERSKVMLSEYNIPRDNSWHEVYIALDDFKIWEENLDFSQTKVFFAAAIIGEFVNNNSGIFYISDARYVRRKEVTPSMSAMIKRRDDSQPASEITWSTAQLGGGWVIADHSLEVTYETVNPSWGVQIYTDNTKSSASPRYSGDPMRYLDQQPLGLIGEGEPFVTCPMTWMVLDDTNPNIPIPKEVNNGFPSNHPDYRVYFASDWGQAQPKGEWSWLKDVSSTRWDDKNSNLQLDLTGNFGDPNYEIVADFSSTGDEYSTFISPTGLSTGWGSVDDGTRVYILNPQSPIVIYLAAKFQNAKVLQRYKTNTLTLELYHY